MKIIMRRDNVYGGHIDPYDELPDDFTGDGYQQSTKEVDPLDNYPEVHYYSGRIKKKLEGVHDGCHWSDWIYFKIPATSVKEAAHEFNLMFSGVTTWWPSKKYGYMPWQKI